MSPALAELRLATAALHQEVETDADVEAALRDLSRRPAAVGRFLVLHDAVERGLEPWREALSEAGHDFEARSEAIRRGLAELEAPQPEPLEVPPPASLGEAFGWVYVVEGSMLGGRVMRRSMTADGIPLTGLDFLDPHGDATGSRWQAFVRTMESACASGRALRSDVVKGGSDAFELAYAVLVPLRPDERTR